MKTHNPLNEKNVQVLLAKAAKQLRFLEMDDWAEDIEQTAASIQKELDEARIEEWSKGQKITKETIAQERYEDLCNYFDNDKNTIETLVNNREEFFKWLERMKWHVKKADELFKENEAYKEAFGDIREELKSNNRGTCDYQVVDDIENIITEFDKHNPSKIKDEKEQEDEIELD